MRLVPACALFLTQFALADTYSIQIPSPSSPGPARQMGANKAPDGTTITYDNLSLLKNGQPWLPIMG